MKELRNEGVKYKHAAILIQLRESTRMDTIVTLASYLLNQVY